jgi:gas vesicle protein
MITFICGMFVGAFLGSLAVALCVAAKRGDEHGQSN